MDEVTCYRARLSQYRLIAVVAAMLAILSFGTPAQAAPRTGAGPDLKERRISASWKAAIDDCTTETVFINAHITNGSEPLVTFVRDIRNECEFVGSFLQGEAVAETFVVKNSVTSGRLVATLPLASTDGDLTGEVVRVDLELMTPDTMRNRTLSRVAGTRTLVRSNDGSGTVTGTYTRDGTTVAVPDDAVGGVAVQTAISWTRR